MRKLPLQDVIVKTPTRRRRAVHEEVPETDTRHFEQQPPVVDDQKRDDAPHRDNGLGAVEPPERRRRSVGERRWFIVALGIVGVIVLSSVVLSLLFAGATVTVYPKQDTPVVGAQFEVHSDGEGGTLAFERMVIDKTQQQTVVALGEEEVEERANGKITIYNKYSDVPQRLIKNTRFESTDGRIYRIRESVEVPGQKSDGTPGTIEVTVYAELSGEEYNMGPDDFSIPGFVDLPQEGKVYARSVADMSGGFVGITRTVDEADRARALEELESTLRKELLAAAFDSNDKPQGYILFKEAVFFEFNILPDEVAESDKVVLQLSGKLHAVLLQEARLAERLAQFAIAAYDGSPIVVENPHELTVSIEPVYDEGMEVRAAWEADSYSMSIQGKTHFIWQYDAVRLAQDLVGKEKNILDTPLEGGIREAYPGIDNLQASVRPFWKRTFPDSIEDIVVLTELDS